MKAISGPPMAIATILQNPSSVKNGLGSSGMWWYEPSPRRRQTITWSIIRTTNVRRPQAPPVRPFVAHDWHPIRKLMTNIARRLIDLACDIFDGNPGPSVIMRRSPLVETLHPFAEMAFVDTPLAADLESAEFFSLDHSHYGSTGQSQQLGGFLDGQQAYGSSRFSTAHPN